MKTACADLGTEDARLYTKFHAVWENLYIKRTSRFMIPVHSKIGQEMMHFERVVSWCGRKQLIAVYIEDNILSQFLSEQRSEIYKKQYYEKFSAARTRVRQSSALVSPTKILNTDLAPIGDASEPTEAPREDVEMENDEDARTVGSGGSQGKNESQ